MSNIDILKQIETKLRKPDTDKNYLSNQLMVFAAIIAHGKDQGAEDGLIRAAMGGMQYCLNRLREIWRNPAEPEPKSLPELEEIFAGVELQRFARTEKELADSRARFQRENLMVNVHELILEDESKVYVFSSRINQTTIDGDKILAGEILDAACAPVPSFQVIYRELVNPNKKRRR